MSLDESARVLPKEKIESSTFHSMPQIDDDERAVLAANAGLGGVLLIPVRVGDRDLGVLEMWRSSEVAPNRGEIALLEELCSRVAHCLDRAWMLASLAHREASLRALFWALPDIIYYVGRDGAAVVPPFLQDGLFPKLSHRASLLDVVPQEYHPQLLEMLARTMDTGTVEQFHFPIFSEGRQYDARIAPMFETAAVVVLRDMTGD
jgi:hypothetical protein